MEVTYARVAFFFFSSRRRHTRFDCDWSSDVCSSDLSFLMPFITKDLGFNNQQVGLIASALSFTWAVSAFLGGALSDHTGRRKAVLLASAIAFSLCSVLSGLAGSFLALFAARFLMGLVEGPFMPE